MADWGGFSEAELRHLRSGGDVVLPKSKAKSTGKKSLGAIKTTKSKVESKSEPKAELKPEQKNALKDKSTENSPLPDTKVEELKESPKVEDSDNFITDEESIVQKTKIKTEDLNRLQAEMEEKNKRRKVALSQEILSRRKKAAAETKMLKTIEAELAKLDQLLNADVSVLRDQIDTASFEYNEARRRFDVAEKEYVSSKFDLQQKTEVKDTLTEHLVQLIQLNEQRKLKKLEELTYKLSMDPEVIAEREKEAAEQIKEAEEQEKLKREQDRQKRMEEEARLKEEVNKKEIVTENSTPNNPEEDKIDASVSQPEIVQIPENTKPPDTKES